MRPPVVQPLAFVFATPTGAVETDGPLRMLALAVISTRVRGSDAGLGEGVGVSVGDTAGDGEGCEVGVGIGVGVDEAVGLGVLVGVGVDAGRLPPVAASILLISAPGSEPFVPLPLKGLSGVSRPSGWSFTPAHVFATSESGKYLVGG